jgi:hypothetical protein
MFSDLTSTRKSHKYEYTPILKTRKIIFTIVLKSPSGLNITLFKIYVPTAQKDRLQQGY